MLDRGKSLSVSPSNHKIHFSKSQVLRDVIEKWWSIGVRVRARRVTFLFFKGRSHQTNGLLQSLDSAGDGVTTKHYLRPHTEALVARYPLLFFCVLQRLFCK